MTAVTSSAVRFRQETSTQSTSYFSCSSRRRALASSLSGRAEFSTRMKGFPRAFSSRTERSSAGM